MQIATCLWTDPVTVDMVYQMVTLQKVEQLSEELNAFANSAEGTSLYLLNALEKTVDACTAGENLMRASSDIARGLCKRVANLKTRANIFLDPDDTTLNALESGYKTLEAMLPGVLQKKSAVDARGELNDGQAELLNDAFNGWVNAVATYIEVLKDLRARVITHDLAAERASPTEEFGSVQELVSSLNTPSGT